MKSFVKPINLSIKHKFIIGIVLILIFAMMPLSVVFIKKSENLLIEALEDKADLVNRNLSVVSAIGIQDNAFSYLQSIINEVGAKDKDINQLVIAFPNRIVIASSDNQKYQLFSKIENSTVLRQLEKKKDVIIRNKDKSTLESVRFIYTKPGSLAESDELTDQKEMLLGFIYIVLDTTYLEESVRKLWFQSVILAIFITVMGIVCAYLVGSGMTKPIKELADKASYISVHRDLEQRIQYQSNDELGVLSSAFNAMIESLKSYYDGLQESNKILNQEIKEREKAEEKYRGIFENAVEGIFQSTPEGRFLSLNPALAIILGYDSPDEMIELMTNIKEQLYVIPEDRDELFRLADTHEKVFEFETRLYCRDRSEVWISLNVRPVRDEKGNLLFIEGMAEDITKRKEAEALEQNYKTRLEKEVEERTRELSETLEELRQSQAQLIQSEKMAALGQLIAGVAHEINTPLGAIRASAGNITSSLDETLEGFPCLFRILSEDELRIFFSLLRSASEKNTNLSAKEERKLKRALTRILEEQEIGDADTIADTLTDMRIHENTDEFLPLFRHSENRLILQIAYNLSGLRRGTENITLATDRASKIVFALKSYARFDHTGEPIRADLTEGIETVLTLYHNQLKQGIDVIRNYEELPQVICYPDELNQVWTNLIHNAIQAMEGKGTLTIDLSFVSETQETGFFTRNPVSENYVVVAFIDTGKGIPYEIRERIFEPFFTTKPAGEGSGLGLDIVKKIIEKHKGEISVESEAGRTVFRVMLPVKPQ